MGYVYMLVGPTGKVYVGKTVRKHLRSYLNGCANTALRGSNNKPKLYRAFRKYGPQDFKVCVLFESDNNDHLCAWEKFHIQDQMSVEYGYNVASGGEGAGYTHGPDCKHCLWARSAESTEHLKRIRSLRVYPPKKEKIRKGWTTEQRAAAAGRMPQQLAAHPEWEKGRGAKSRWKGHVKQEFIPKTQEEIRKAAKASRPTSTSRYVGVTWESSRNKWKSTIYFNKKRKILGRFLSELDAATAYDAAAKEYLGIGPINIA